MRLGETLAKRLEKEPLPLNQVFKYRAQIADALDKAHRSGVVHRDLKPGNIMLTPTGAKLLDFGLAKPAVSLASVAAMSVAATQDSPVTERGTIVGTFQYMSPEQVEGKELDGRSDIFSLGAVLYEMLTGQRAFPGKSQLGVAAAILEKEPAPISSIKPITPPALSAFCEGLRSLRRFDLGHANFWRQNPHPCSRAAKLSGEYCTRMPLARRPVVGLFFHRLRSLGGLCHTLPERQGPLVSLASWGSFSCLARGQS
jgi:serine/threonine protein kinase